MSNNQKKSLGLKSVAHYDSEIKAADHVKIDFNSIPDYVRDELAATILAAVRSFLRQPGGREKLDKKIAEKYSAL